MRSTTGPNQNSWLSPRAIKQSCVYPLCRRLWHAVDRVGFLASAAYLYDARIVLYELSHGLPPQTPQFGEFADAIVLLGVTGIESHSN